MSDGIKIKGDWFPGLRMDWVEGVPIDEYVVLNVNDSAKLGELAAKFLKMMEDFQQLGIAHGDLQHGNIIICGDEIRVVDYDGMFVPPMGSFAACELGHRNYQAPKRTALHFGPNLDNFSAWVIYASIKALQIDSTLLNQLGGADDCLLFREIDFLNPLQSAAFASFEKHPDSNLRVLGKFIRAQLAHDISQIPYLQVNVPALQSVPPDIPDSVAKVKAGPRLVRGNVDEWLDGDNLDQLGVAIEGSGGGDRSQNSWAVQAKDVPAATWMKPGTAVPELVVQNSTDAGEDVDSIPRELTGPKPRQVRLRHLPAIGMQLFFQMIVLFAWSSFPSTIYSLVVADPILKMNARAYPATVLNTTIRSESRGKNGRATVTDVTYKFFVNGVAYSDTQKLEGGQTSYHNGSKVIIYADPANPRDREPLSSYPGKKLEDDFALFFSSGLLLLVFEIFIWWRTLLALYLVREGTPIWVTVSNKIDFSFNGLRLADFSFTRNGKRVTRCVLLNHTEYRLLSNGDVVLALYEPIFEPYISLLQVYDLSPIVTKTGRP